MNNGADVIYEERSFQGSHREL